MDNHEAMHGETVGLFEPFSNGVQVPDELAGSPPPWAAEMQARANQLRRAGLSYEQIAEAVTMSNTAFRFGRSIPGSIPRRP